jgi:hypothetical protein
MLARWPGLAWRRPGAFLPGASSSSDGRRLDLRRHGGADHKAHANPTLVWLAPVNLDVLRSTRSSTHTPMGDAMMTPDEKAEAVRDAMELIKYGADQIASATAGLEAVLAAEAARSTGDKGDPA